MKKLLIVDDCRSIFRILEHTLGGEFDCRYAASVDEAVSLLDGGYAPDAIVSDLNMPEKTGADLLAAVRGMDAFRRLPFLILSAEQSSAARVRLISSGADDFLTKPFNPEELKVRLLRFFR